MPKFKAFYGLVPDVKNVEKVAAVPYDVVNTKEAAALASGNPLSFLHVSRPEIDLAPGIDLHDEKVYNQAGKAFRKLVAEAPLIQDSEKHLYVYRLIMNERSQIGIIGCASAQEYRDGLIKRHEKTRQDKEDDRTKHLMAIHSQTGPAFFTFRDVEEIDICIKKTIKENPLFDFIADDGIRHTVWRLAAEQSKLLEQQFETLVPVFYIADGHHRSAAAVRTYEVCRKAAGKDYSGDEEFNYFLAVAFPASQLKILPYNRVVRDFNGLSREDFFAKISSDFNIEKTLDGEVTSPGQIKLYTAGEWFLLTPKFSLLSLGVVGSLDASYLQEKVLAPYLGIDDPRTSKRIDFIGGIRGTKELIKLVDSGEYKLAFSMPAVTLPQLMAIADAGEIMPPKSTWFEPKLRDGLVSHNF